MSSRVTLAAIAAAALVATAAVSYIAGRGDSAPDVASVIAAPAVAQEVTTQASGGFSAPQRTEIGDIVREYLMENPEVIRDAIIALQEKEELTAKADQVKAIDDRADLIFSSPRQVVLGNPDGDVTLVEFFDYNCGYCKRAHADMVRLIDEDPNLRIVLKEFPVLGPPSVEAAQIASAVAIIAPEKYADFHEVMLSEPGPADGARAIAVATDLGLEEDALRKTADSDEVRQYIMESRMLASELQLTGTPSYVTRQDVIVGAVGFDELKNRIAAAREACKDTDSVC